MIFVWFFIVVKLWTCAVASDSALDVVSRAGEDCVLSCVGPPEGTALTLEWTSPQGYVLIYRNHQLLDIETSPLRNRIQLRDPDLKTGDLSVILKNLTLENSGTYHCVALVQTSRGRQEVSQCTNLTVTEPVNTARDGATETARGGATETARGGATEKPVEDPGRAPWEPRSRLGVIISSVVCAVLGIVLFIICSKKHKLRTAEDQNISLSNHITTTTTH